MIIVIKRRDGGVSIMRMMNKDADVYEQVKKWEKSYGDGSYVSHRVMPDRAVPNDRSFRDAWADETPEPIIDISMGKAKEICRRKLREARKPLLIELDAQYMKALEVGNQGEMARITAKKQALRDAPQDPRIEAAQTPEDLKKVTL